MLYRSHIHVPCSLFPGEAPMNTAEFLMIASSVVPERTAMVCGQRSRTYAEMQERVNRLANGLQAMGVAKGDKRACRTSKT
ncbi:MAG: long-chain fatty acid--CoA ligase [Chloroflexi bacterium]|nr:MAG: long-chain fatty acid--CoA ligase [Chloroflexota bacterium]